MEGDATFSPRGLTSGDFNPRPPWGGRLRNRTQETPSVGISIHALRGEDDVLYNMKFNTTNRFQSTPSVGRTTATQIYRCLDINISIHALRGEDDNLVGLYGRAILISIHALRGEDDSCRLCRVNVVNLFQSTPSVGRTTRSESIRFAVFHLFQSTPSVGRTTFPAAESAMLTNISIHALRGEDDV